MKKKNILMTILIIFIIWILITTIDYILPSRFDKFPIFSKIDEKSNVWGKPRIFKGLGYEIEVIESHNYDPNNRIVITKIKILFIEIKHKDGDY